METGGPHCGGGEGDRGVCGASCTHVHELCADADSGLCLYSPPLPARRWAVADNPGSTVSSGLTAGAGPAACLEEETRVVRNWYPESQPCYSLDVPGWTLKTAPESHTEKGTAVNTI